MGLQYRPLGAVKAMLEQIGIEITYAYEDPVFVEGNHFLLQFGQVGEVLFFYANVEAVAADVPPLFAAIQAGASGQGITLIRRGRYQLTAGEGENLSLQFLADTESAQ